MSLKAFHLVFVIASTLLALGFAAWSFRQYANAQETLQLGFGIGSLLAAAGLMAYGKFFLKKLKHISYL